MGMAKLLIIIIIIGLYIIGFIMLLLLLFLYPSVYSYERLKAKKLKSKLEWLLVRNVVDQESVVQKNRVETLQRHQKTPEQKWWRSFLTRETAEFVTEITQELQSWQAEDTKIFNGNRLKRKIRCQVEYFANFRSDAISATAPTPVPPFQRKIDYWHSYVPSQWFSALPRD